jgi:hypothetical protein
MEDRKVVGTIKNVGVAVAKPYIFVAN